MPDGKIVFSTELDNKGLEKDFREATKEVERQEKKLAQKEADRLPIVEELKKANAEAVTAYNNVERLKKALANSQMATSADGETGLSPAAYIAETEKQKQLTAELKEQEKVLRAKEKLAEHISKKDEQAVAAIQRQTAELNRQKEKAGALAAQLAQTGPSSERMANAMVRAQKNAKRFALRLKEVVRSALVFTLITQSLAKFREWVGKVIKTNDEAAAATARLKGALLTLAQPLVEFILPAFVTLVNILTRVVTAMAGLMSALFGKSVDQSKEAAAALQSEADALDATGNSAKKAGKSLASFDEINKLSNGDPSAASAGATTPNFELDTTELETDMDRILGLAKIIGAALLTWKLSGTLTDDLGTFLGMLMAIEGGILFAKGAMDAWNDGVVWDNIRDMLLGAFLLVAGLSAVLGTTAGGIALLVSGFAMLAIGIKDVLEQGWTMQNLFLTIAGILAAGLGISVLTGSWIPMLVAAIGSILLAITVLTGNGGQLIENLKQIFRGFITFIDGLLTGDLDKILDGAKEMVKGTVNTVLTIVGSLVNAIIKGLNWLISKINSIRFSIPDWVPGVGGKSYSPRLPSVAEWQIPQLATGAVIPPNREFLAVLGDQTHGNNIEAPEDLIRKIVREESGGMNTALLQAILAAIREGKVLTVDRDVFAKLVYSANKSESNRIGMNLSEV